MDTAIKIQKTIRKFRANNPTWLQPTDLRCLQFAATEAAEAMDEWIRFDRKFFRTTERASTVYDLLCEVADCLMMLLSVNQEIEDYFQYVEKTEIDDLFLCTLMMDVSTMCVDYIESGEITPSLEIKIAKCVFNIMSVDVDWEQIVNGRLERIKSKIQARLEKVE